MADAPYPEPPGYSAAMGFTKANPKNNAYYISHWEDDPLYDLIVLTDQWLEKLIPGYNITQLKLKFDDLRFYVDRGGCPPEVWDENVSKVMMVTSFCELASGWFRRGREYQKGLDE